MNNSPNTRSLILFAGGAVFIVFTLMLLRALMDGNMMKVAVFAGLAFALLFNAFRKYWIGMLLGSCAIYSGGTEMPIFTKYPPYAIIMALIAGYFVMHYALKKKAPFLRWRAVYTLFLLVAVAVTARIIYDRPGAGSLGGSGGGLKKAMDFAFAVYAFFVAYWATTQAGTWKANLRVILVISLVSYGVVQLGLRVLTGMFEESVYGISFNWSLYPIYAALIAGSFSPKLRRLFSLTPFVIASIFILGMGAISQTRAAILQVPLMIFTAAFIYRRIPTAFVMLALVGAVGMGTLLVAIPYRELPDNVRRPLSVFMGADRTERSYGTKDEFRDELHEYAYKKIKQSPYIGSGWAFDYSELISAMSFSALAKSKEYGHGGGQLNMTGAFHNVFLILATSNGVPTAFVQVAAILIAMISMAFYARKQADGPTKSAITFLLVFSSCVFVMYFLNGGAWDAFALSAALGAAYAIRDTDEQSLEEPLSKPAAARGQTVLEEALTQTT